MNETIYREETDKTPRIEGDLNKGTFLMSGRSLSENTKEYYTPILDWLQEFCDNVTVDARVEFEIEYFNTSTSLFILEVLNKFKILSATSPVKMTWHYEDDDIEMREVGQGYKDMVGDILRLQPRTL